MLPLPVPAMKLVPAMVSVVLPDPAAIVLGLSEEMAGAATVSVDAADVPEEFGLCTVMLREPAVSMALLGTVAVIEVAVPAVTVKAVEPI